MYAVIETGGKQYRVAPGQNVKVETLPGEPGASVEFGKVLAIVDDAGNLSLGAATASAKVTGKIKAQGRGEKVIVFKFKRKKQYKRTIGHRQNFTEVEVGAIQA
jgi:large subunit ribosomal protein L21